MGGNGGSNGRPASLALANERWRSLMIVYISMWQLLVIGEAEE